MSKVESWKRKEAIMNVMLSLPYIPNIPFFTISLPKWGLKKGYFYNLYNLSDP